MLPFVLKATWGEDHDHRRFAYFGRQVRLPFFGRVVLVREGFRDMTIWFGDEQRTPLEALEDALEWARNFVPKVRKPPPMRRQGPLGKTA